MVFSFSFVKVGLVIDFGGGQETDQANALDRAVFIEAVSEAGGSPYYFLV
jgi:hypothetical protein